MRKVIALLSLVGGMLFIPAASYAVGSSGFELATNSARSLARSNAVTADPEEPTTIAFNPAGLTKLEGNQVTTSTSIIIPMTQYDGLNGGVSEDASTPVSFVPATFVSLSTPVKDLHLGLGLNSPFGLQTHYSSTGNFKYTGYFNEIITAGYSASAAYQFSSWLSVGGGFTYLESDLKQVAKLNSNLITQTFAPGFPFPVQDSPFEIDADGYGVGWNAGVLLTPNETHSIGIFYRSQIQVEYRGTMDVDSLPDPVMTFLFGGPSFHTSADTDVTFPDSLTVGYRYSPTEQWDIELDVAWTNWSVFDRIDIAFGTSNAVLDALEPVNEAFDDAISISLGTSYDLNERWTLHGGCLYYERAASKENYSNVIPDGDRYSLSFGVEYNASPISINVSYMATLTSDVEIDNAVGSAAGAVVDGEYSSFYQLVSLSCTYRF